MTEPLPRGGLTLSRMGPVADTRSRPRHPLAVGSHLWHDGMEYEKLECSVATDDGPDTEVLACTRDLDFRRGRWRRR